MKKALAFVAALLIAVLTCSAALADTTYSDFKSVDLPVTYSLLNDGTKNPAETFNFKIEKVSVTDSPLTLETMPAFSPAQYTISYAAGEATVAGAKKTNTVTLPDFSRVGIYTYKVTQIPGTTVGVVYDANPLYLKVTAIEQSGIVRVVALHYETIDGLKTEGFKNQYQAGSLEVSNEVLGNLGDIYKDFTVTVTFTAPEDGGDLDITYTDDGETKKVEKNPDGTYTAVIDLKDDETVTFDNVPYGVEYTVKENDYTDEGYTTTYDESDKGTMDAAKETVEVINEKNGEVDTGVILENLPYVMVILAVAGLGFVMFMRKRSAIVNG